MKMEEHFKETLSRAVANEPPAVDAWDRFARRTQRGRRMRLFGALAAAAAVAVAAVIVVPKLGTESPQGKGIRFASPPPTVDPSPPPTVDPYAGWKTYENADGHYRLRYPSDWKQSSFEHAQEFTPPGLRAVSGAGGDNSFGVTVEALDRVGQEIPPDAQRGTLKNGRAFASREQVFDRVRTRAHWIDWSEANCGAPPAACPSGDSFMLAVYVIGDESPEFFATHIATAELILDSLERI